MQRLEGKTALVTGASRGIGRAIAERLAADGAHVIAHYSHSRGPAEALAAATGATLVQADLATHAGIQQLADVIDAPLDILVNNAGIATMVPYGQHTAEDFDAQFAVNARAPILLTQALHDRLAENGRVIFISTVGTRLAFNDGALLPYSASKGAIDTTIVHLAPVLGARGITVNGVAPGIIATDMNPWLDMEGGPEAAHAVQALKRVGQADDVADVVAFLASNDGRWVTGQVIQAGGGTKL